MLAKQSADLLAQGKDKFLFGDRLGALLLFEKVIKTVSSCRQSLFVHSTGRQHAHGVQQLQISLKRHSATHRGRHRDCQSKSSLLILSSRICADAFQVRACGRVVELHVRARVLWGHRVCTDNPERCVVRITQLRYLCLNHSHICRT